MTPASGPIGNNWSNWLKADPAESSTEEETCGPDSRYINIIQTHRQIRLEELYCP
jgi:hypothetical protein